MQRWLQSAATHLILAGLAIGLWLTPIAPANALLISALPPGNAVTNGAALLRRALPIDNDPIRQIETNLEEIAEELRGKRWSAIARNTSNVRRLLQTKRDALLADVVAAEQANIAAVMDDMAEDLATLDAAIETKDKEATWLMRRELLGHVSEIEEAMVQGFPFEVPADYSHLPQLKGHATVEMVTTQGTLTIVADGYNAPVSAGNFIDLVQRGFYDGLEFNRALENFLVQTGDPPGDATGFIDPDTGEYRAVPLEIRVAGDDLPIYGFTLESLGLYMEEPMLPFSALGTVAIARPLEDPDGGSSQIFFQLYDPEVTPAGRNLLDGRYAAFGYVVENEALLKEIQVGDRIESAKVVKGLENLVLPTS